MPFHNSLDDGNASITPKYRQNPLCHPISSRCQRAYQTRVTFGLVFLCRKKHLATCIKLGKALSLKVEDIGKATVSHATPPWPAVAGSFGL
jgi:hypothetical protein